ncbi:MAG: protein kinase, partial [Planctomycetota bacterium]
MAALPRIDGYRIEGVLGRGTTGVVYSAVQLAVDRPVALKILHAHLVGTKRAVRRLQREARTAARLAHPSIITAIDMGQQDGQWWYAMELVEGISLADRIKEKGVFTEREALRFFIPLCDALQHAYEGGVVHRDIKPANILIDAHGSARLVDLGLAFAEDDPLITAPGGTLGTPHYISPEQAKNPSSADSQSDLWSLGATMYHALCGRPPFAGTSVAEILSGVLYGRVPEPRKLAPQLSKGLALVLRKCLTRDPERRYREPAQLLRDLERIRERRSPHVRASNLDPVDTGRPAWMGRALGVGGAALLVLLGTLWITRPWEERARRLPEGFARQAGWAELEQLKQDFQQGVRMHAATLDTLGMLEAPEGFGPSKRNFGAQVIGDLNDRVGQLTDEFGAQMKELREGHEFQVALIRLDGVRLELKQRTGFIEPTALPDTARGILQGWTGRQRKLLTKARGEAVRAGSERLEAYFERTLEPEFDRLTAEHLWRDALDLLEPRDAWLGAEAAGVILRGLNPEELQRILDSVRRTCRAKIQDASNAYHRLDRELANFVDDEHRSLEDKIRASTVDGAWDVLEKAYQGECDARGIDPAQIPRSWLEPEGNLVGSTLRLRRAKSELKDLESRTLRERALKLFPFDDRTASRLCRDRRYVEAEAFWEEHLDDPASVAVRGWMQMRLRETRHLEAFLAQAADGVRLRMGLEFRPVIDGMEFDGTIATAGNVLERGFKLRPKEQKLNTKLIHLVRPDRLPKDEHLLTATYVLELADLAGTAQDRYRSALFLFYEDELEKAREILPNEDREHEFNDLLGGERGLRERIKSALVRQDRDRQDEQEFMDALIGRIRRGAETGSTSQLLQLDIDTLFEEYGDLLDQTVA